MFRRKLKAMHKLLGCPSQDVFLTIRGYERCAACGRKFPADDLELFAPRIPNKIFQRDPGKAATYKRRTGRDLRVW